MPHISAIVGAAVTFAFSSIKAPFRALRC